MGFKVFISHSMDSEDTDVLYAMAHLLRQNSIGAYVAEWNPQYGNSLSEKVKREIDDSDLVLVILTNMSSRSAFVHQEIGYAEDKKQIIPMVESGVDIKGFLVGKEYAEFDRHNYELTMRNVVDYIHKIKTDREDQAFLGWILIGAVGLLGLAFGASAFAPKPLPPHS